jgi:hypothetical protein
MYSWEDEDISDLAGGPCKQSALINFRFLLYVVSLSPSLPSSQWTHLSLHGQLSQMIKTLQRKGQRNLAIVIPPFNSLLSMSFMNATNIPLSMIEQLWLKSWECTPRCLSIFFIAHMLCPNIGRQRQSMLGFRINALPTRSALVPDFPRHTISHRSPLYSAPLIPPLLLSSRTLQFQISSPPPFSLVFNNPLHAPHPL